MHDVMALVCEHDKDSVHQTEERQVGKFWKELSLKESFGLDEGYGSPSYKACEERNAQVLSRIQFDHRKCAEIE
jgi:hypothetical protein